MLPSICLCVTGDRGRQFNVVRMMNSRSAICFEVRLPCENQNTSTLAAKASAPALYGV